MSTALLPKLLRTPMSRLVRGKIGPEATSTSLLEESALPGEAKALIARVVKKTRLWAREKREVAEELADHFSAALEGGGSVEEAVAAFGDADKAAKLIRRGKMRNRPLWWRTWRHGRNLAGLVLLAYAGIFAAFLVGHPTIATDYVAQYNAAAVGAPAEQRAWPLYKEAIDKLAGAIAAERTAKNIDQWHMDAMLGSEPSHKKWKDLVAFLGAHQDVMELASAAAERTTMAYIAGFEPEAGDPATQPAPQAPASEDQDHGMIDVQFPHLNHFRDLAMFVASDARAANVAGDPQRFMRDASALLRTGSLLCGHGTILEQLVGFGILDLGRTEVDRALRDGHLKFNGAELAELGHLVARSRSHLDLGAERLMFYDFVQRIFTDNGRGDGYVNLRGVRALLTATSIVGAPREKTELSDQVLEAVALTGSPALMASRRETVAEFDRLMDLSQLNMDRPMREANWAAVNDRIAEIRAPSPLGRRFAVIAGLWPGLERAQRTSERHNGMAEGLMVAVACEAYLQRHGEYPDRLEKLVPELLPAIPADRINGQPLRYKLANGKPLIYSVGADRADDGGKVAVDRKGKKEPWLAAEWDVQPARAAKGDWILFPDPHAADNIVEPSDKLDDSEER